MLKKCTNYVLAFLVLQFMVHPRRRKETQSLPLGPVEVSTQWYARARLGFSTLVLFLWGTTEEGTVFKEGGA